MEESGQPQAGKPAKKKRFDKKKAGARRMGPKPRGFLRDDEERFLLAYKAAGFVPPAAMRVGISIHAAYHILEKPLAKRFLEKLTEEKVKAAAKVAAHQFRIDETFVNEKLYDAIVGHVTHESKGDEVLNKHLTLAFKVLGVIDKPTPPSHVGIQVSAGGAGVPPNANSFQIYEAQWLREKKEAWARELEHKHAPALTTGEPQTSPAV